MNQGSGSTLSYSWRVRSYWSNPLMSLAEFGLGCRLHCCLWQGLTAVLLEAGATSQRCALQWLHSLVWSHWAPFLQGLLQGGQPAQAQFFWTWPNHILCLDILLKCDFRVVSWNTTSPFCSSPPTSEHIELNIMFNSTPMAKFNKLAARNFNQIFNLSTM